MIRYNIAHRPESAGKVTSWWKPFMSSKKIGGKKCTERQTLSEDFCFPRCTHLIYISVLVAGLCGEKAGDEK